MADPCGAGINNSRMCLFRKPSFANGRICGSSRKGRVIVFDPKHHVVEANGIRIHVAEQGEGYELVAEVRHLLKPLSVLDEPELVRRVEAEMAAV